MSRKNSKIKFSGGWIAPDGTFYPVEYSQHQREQDRLVKKLGIKLKHAFVELTDIGWIKVQGGAPKGWSETLRILNPITKHFADEGTQAQLDTSMTFDW